MIVFGHQDKRPAAVEEAALYIRSMFAGLEETGPLPREAFADPYVVGFLQVLTTHSVAVVYRSAMPDEAEIVAIMADAIDRLYPGSGSTARMGAVDYGNPLSPRHDGYRRGRHDGSEHVRRLLTTFENMGDERHRAFQDHVRRCHLR